MTIVRYLDVPDGAAQAILYLEMRVMIRNEPGAIRLFLLGMAVLIPAVWLDTSLTGGDEYRNTFRTALETSASEDWTIPTLDQQPRLRKPPLYYWWLAASIEWFGSSPLSLRIWGIVSAVLLALVAAAIGRKSSGTSGVLIFVMLIGTIGLATESRRAMLDVPMAFLLLLSVERGLHWRSHGGPWRAVTAGILLAMATLIKPTALLFGATALISLFLLGTRRSPHAKLHHLLYMMMALLMVALPWWAHVYQQYPDLLQSRWTEQIAHRELTWFHPEALPSLLGGLLGLVVPWSIASIFALVSFSRRKEAGLENNERWMVLWVILSALPFLFMKTFERYLIPLLPVMVILTATYLQDLDPHRRIKQLRTATILLGIPCLLVAAFVGWFQCSPLATGMIGVSCLLMWWTASQDRWLGCALCSAAQLAIVMGIALPSIGIGALPTIPTACIDSRFATVGIDLLPTLSLHQQMAIPILKPDVASMKQKLPAQKSTLFLMDTQLAATTNALQILGRKSRSVANFSLFRSRKIYTRFPRADATAADWRQALQERSLDRLRIPCTILLVEAREDH